MRWLSKENRTDLCNDGTVQNLDCDGGYMQNMHMIKLYKTKHTHTHTHPRTLFSESLRSFV